MQTVADLLVIGGVSVSPAEVIKRHRLNLMIHSYLYYWLDDPVWSDDKWQECANTLTDLQSMFPEPINFYDKEFEEWNGSTGMHLPKDDYVVSKALNIFRLKNYGNKSM